MSVEDDAEPLDDSIALSEMLSDVLPSLFSLVLAPVPLVLVVNPRSCWAGESDDLDDDLLSGDGAGSRPSIGDAAAELASLIEFGIFTLQQKASRTNTCKIVFATSHPSRA